VRSFNSAFAQTYGRTPSVLRRKQRPHDSNEILLKLSYRPPFDWNELCGFLVPRVTPGVESVESGVYRRTIHIDGKSGIVDVRSTDKANHLELRVDFPDAAHLFRIAEQVRRIFDLDADPVEISSHLRRDALLAPLVRSRPGTRVPGAWDGFELTVRAILGQQVSVKGATTLAGRMVQRYGEPLPEPVHGLSHLFPRAERLLRIDPSRIGVPRARGAAIKGLARAVLNGEVDFEATPEEGIRQLKSLRGVGDWTAQYVAMRAFRDPDGFPASDLALLRSLGDGTGVKVRELLERAEGWRPWRAYAAMHLWRRYGTLV
jgi:AraC family transcriptional regulator of adaptative response / DNA-3-methyladenine glycosylase II